MRVWRSWRRWKSAFVSEYPRAINSSIRISVAPSPVELDGSSSSRSIKTGLSSGKALKSLPSRSKQACGVGARYACQAALAVSLSSLLGERDAWRPPLAKPLKLDHREVDQTKLQPGDSLRMRPEIIE